MPQVITPILVSALGPAIGAPVAETPYARPELPAEILFNARPPQPPSFYRTALSKAHFDALRVPNMPGGEAQSLDVVGTCLEPHICDGDRVFFDASRSARDGDFVLVWCSEKTLALVESSAAGQEYAERIGVYPRLNTKALLACAGAYYLANNVGVIPLEDNTILAVVTRVERNGEVVA